ncbi:MAG: hypothetical protein IKK21_06735 [Clostridia bacterium]|nr:hypothetical protein [Clostridia bacterium]
MLKKLLSFFLFLILSIAPCCADTIAPLPEGWMYAGYTYGGITFPVPADVVPYELSDQEQAMGIVLVCYNADFMLQLRRFTPNELSWEQYRDLMLGTSTAQVRYSGDDQRVLCVTNTMPSPDSELVGIALNGLDGNLYKISIFTGFDGDCSPNAVVWDIAQIIADYTSQMDFADWLPGASAAQ